MIIVFCRGKQCLNRLVRKTRTTKDKKLQGKRIDENTLIKKAISVKVDRLT